MGNYEIREYNEELIWKSEIEWIYRLMPDEVLLKLKDVIQYAIDTKEYERCPISCGDMRFLIVFISNELRIREMEKTGITYREASAKIIEECTPKLESVVEGEEKVKDDTSDGSETGGEEGKTDSI